MAYFVVQTEASDALGPQGLFVFNSSTAGVAGTDPSSAPFNARQYTWVPYDTTLKNVLMRLTAAPGAAHTENFRVHNDSDGAVSAVMSISGTATDVLTDVEGTLPGLDVTNDSTIRTAIHYLTSWPQTGGNAAGTAFRAYEYLCVAHPELCFFVLGIGADIQTATFGGTDAFAPIVGGTIASGATSNVYQIPMPIKGKIKVAWAAWRGYDNTSTVEACIQKGALGAAADTAALITMVGAGTTTPYQAAIITPNISVAKDDYLNWRIKRTAGAATGGAIQLGFGYAAGL